MSCVLPSLLDRIHVDEKYCVKRVKMTIFENKNTFLKLRLQFVSFFENVSP